MVGGRRPKSISINPWTAVSFLLTAVLLLPILAVFWAAAGDSEGLWPHLLETTLPRYLLNTLALTGGVSIFALLFGVTSAWLVTRYQFPGRRILEWTLLLPAAVPAYLIAYTYTDFLEYAGPVQGLFRDLFGWRSARDYWFPEIRSMGGAAFVMGAVLYPYVYMMTRTAFLATPASLYEIGIISRRSVFWSVALPLARPAIVAGLAPVVMETISDFGTVEYFAIETLTLGVFNVWLGMNNLPAAAQIASLTFLFVIALIALERAARARQKFTNPSRRQTVLPRRRLKGLHALLALTACATPIVVGFVVPVGVLLSFVLKGYSLGFSDAMLSAAVNALELAAVAAVVVMATALVLGVVGRYLAGPGTRRLTALASVGYAFPGAVLAIGVVTAGGALDDGIAWIKAALFGLDHAGWFASGFILVAFACVVRFQAIGYGAVASSLARMPPSMLEASRTLGRGFGQSLLRVIAPLLRPALLAGGILVFVDVLKELPMTLLLRPFNFETLATFVYQYARDELLEEAALPALAIVGAGIIPVIVLNAAISHAMKK